MITFSRIGQHGRLGNQIFQLAGSLGIARKLNYDIKFPSDFDVPKVFNLDNKLLTERSALQRYNTVSEQGFHFDSNLFSIPDSTDVLGFLQSDKYFLHIEAELRQLLTFRESIQNTAEGIFPVLDAETVSIHVRRGDYVQLQHCHPLCTLDYYQAAVANFFDKDYYFIIFSDDIEYCKSVFGSQENILYLNNTDPYIDLCLMSMCDHNIIANSSFSWWGAWLNKNKHKRVVAPKQWFGPMYSNHDTKDLYCNNWIIL